MRQLKKIFVAGFLLFLTTPTPSFAVCAEGAMPGLDDMLNNINWHCFFPVRIAGTRIDPYESSDDNVDREVVQSYMDESMQTYRSAPAVAESGDSSQIFCQCSSPGNLTAIATGGTGSTVGIRVSFWEPARIIEVVKDSWCFPFLLSNIRGDLTTTNAAGNPEITTRIQKNGSSKVDGALNKSAFWQTHYYVFPVMAILELMTDFVCMDTSAFDLAYISEVDPRWDDPELSALLSPEAVLFANPVAAMACIPDVMAATMKSTIDLLYWCQGGWAPVYPLGGHVNYNDFVESEAAAMGRTIFNLHKSFVLWGTIGDQALCQRYPMPIWRKSQYRWQLMWPRADNKCRVIGEPGMFWTSNKNPPSPDLNMDNFVNLLWRKRHCCAR